MNTNKAVAIILSCFAITAILAVAAPKEAKPIRSYQAAQPDIAAGLVARWQFNEGQGSAIADSTGKFQGALHDGSDKNWAPGKTGAGGLLFDGNAYVEVQKFQFMPTGAGRCMTIAGWIKPDDGFLISKNKDNINSNSFEFGVSIEEGRLSWHGQGVVSALSKLRLDDGAWRHFAVVIDGGIGTWFVDGITDDTFRITEPNHEQKLSLLIGACRTKKSSRIGKFYKGGLLDLRVYDRALTSDEVYMLAKPIATPVSSEKQSSDK